MSRRTFGNIRKRPSGRWQAQYTGPDGKLHSAGVFSSKADADAALSRMQTSMGRKEWVSPIDSKRKVKDLAEEWLHSKQSNKNSTMARNETILRVHILPHIGEQQIGSITTRGVQDLVEKWKADLAPTTVRRQYAVLQALLTYAVEAGWLVKSPCQGIKLPRYSVLTSRSIVTPEQLRDLAEAVGDDYSVAIYLAAETGLRWGEVAGLRMSSLRLLGTQGTITVDEQVTRGAGGRSYLDRPKTQAGRRHLALSSELCGLLASHLLRRGITAAQPESFLFGPCPREHMEYNNFRKRIWQPACEEVGLSGYGFHDLRRFSATVLVDEGIGMKTTQQRLGHANPTTTLALYAKSLPGADEEAAQSVAGHLYGPAKRNRPLTILPVACPRQVVTAASSSTRVPDLHFSGGASWNRTSDLSIISAAL